MRITDANFLFGPVTKGLHQTGMVPSVAGPAVTEKTTQQIPGGVQETTVSVAPGFMTSDEMIAQDKAAHSVVHERLGSRWNDSKKAREFRANVQAARRQEDDIRRLAYYLGTSDPKQMEDRLGLLMFAKGMKQAGIPMSDMTQALNIQRQLAPQTSQDAGSGFTPLQLQNYIAGQYKNTLDAVAKRNPAIAPYLSDSFDASTYNISPENFEMGNKYIKAAIQEHIGKTREYDNLLRAFVDETGPNARFVLDGDEIIINYGKDIGPMPPGLAEILQGKPLDLGDAPMVSPEQSIIPMIKSGGGWMQPGREANYSPSEDFIRKVLSRRGY